MNTYADDKLELLIETSVQIGEVNPDNKQELRQLIREQAKIENQLRQYISYLEEEIDESTLTDIVSSTRINT